LTISKERMMLMCCLLQGMDFLLAIYTRYSLRHEQVVSGLRLGGGLIFMVSNVILLMACYE